MQGSIIKRGDKYSFIIDIGRDPVTKKRKQKRVSGFTSKKKAQKAMNDMIAELNKGAYVEPTNEKLSKYLDDWLKYKKNRVAYSTYRHYLSYVNNHIKPALGEHKVIDLTTGQIEGFYDSLLDNDILSEQSIHHIHRILSNAIGRGADIGELPRNIMQSVDPLKVPKKEMKYWNTQTAQKFIEDTRGNELFIAWYLALKTGMRQGEILGLKWDSIDIDNKVIQVRRALKLDEHDQYIIADLKNSSSYRSIDISDADVFEIKKHMNEQKQIKMRVGSDYQDNDLVISTVTGNFVTPSNLGRSYRRVFNDLDIEQIRFHDLRHTHASMLFELGTHPKIVQERLGHSSIEMTLDTYSHMTPNMQQAVAEKLDSALSNNENKSSNVTNP